MTTPLSALKQTRRRRRPTSLSCLCSDRGHQRLDAHDVHQPGEIVSEHVESLLGGKLTQITIARWEPNETEGIHRSYWECVGATAVSSARLARAVARDIHRLGILTGAARQASRMVALFDELKVLGFVEEHSLKIVVDGFDLREDQCAAVEATLAKAAPDVVLRVSDAAIRAAAIGPTPLQSPP